MASSQPLRSPWSIFKRLKVQPGVNPKSASRASFTTSHLHRQQPDESLSLPQQQPNTPAPRPRRRNPNATKPQDDIKRSLLEIAKFRGIKPPPIFQDPPESGKPRLPRSVQALYLAPLRRTPTHGIPVANLQLRSYSVRNLEMMADFALRAAYYLNLPARGPVMLPRITERWTVPRSNFVHKKSQENFERITTRRLIQIQDGHPEAVRTWLAFVKKWCWYGVGMKADVWEWEGVGTGKKMDANEAAVKRGIESVDWELFGRRKGLEGKDEVGKLLSRQGFAGSDAAAASTPIAKASA